MSSASGLVNRAYLFSKMRFWSKPVFVTQKRNLSSRISFTKHMVGIVAKLSQVRDLGGNDEFNALCKVFCLASGLRSKLFNVYSNLLNNPLPAEHHASRIAALYADDIERRKEVVDRLIRISAISYSFVGRDEYEFLKSVSNALKVSNNYFNHLCKCYGIEIPSDNPYDILGVSKLSSKSELKKRYYQLVREYHPDRVSKSSPAELVIFNNKLSEINQAYGKIAA